MRFSTRAIHVGQDPDPATGATVSPIYQTSTFTQKALGVNKGYEYARTANPTRHALESCLASLENGRRSLAFASGSAATTAVLSLLSPGDRVVAGEDIYGGTYRLFERIFAKYGVSFVYVDARKPELVAEAVRAGTRMVWLETPTNPLLTLADIRAAADVAHSTHAILVVDNTFASPFFQRPLDLGADIVVHSTTKYIGGHSDLVGGAIITNDDALDEALRFHQNAQGAVPGPFDCWLALRGLKTLSVRMRAHEENALRVAEFLQSHPKVDQVFYPGLPNFAQRELAQRQMSGYSGMVSFTVVPGGPSARRVLSRTNVFALAESLGGVESLVGHPATMTHASIPQAERERRGITESLIRLSVGLEDVQDLIDDLGQALA